jgi:glycine cleavage system H protein
MFIAFLHLQPRLDSDETPGRTGFNRHPILLVPHDRDARYVVDDRGASGGPLLVSESGTTLAYRRARFGTRLPTDRVYTRSHYWLLQAHPGTWRVGLTKFATRMLGDLVEYQFETEAGARVECGQKIGWIEGFKAVSDIYAVAKGAFVGVNLNLREDITLLESDPYGKGWLYAVDGEPEAKSLDVDGYVTVLDATIDRMLAGRHDGGDHE